MNECIMSVHDNGVWIM